MLLLDKKESLGLTWRQLIMTIVYPRATREELKPFRRKMGPKEEYDDYDDGK